MWRILLISVNHRCINLLVSVFEDSGKLNRVFFWGGGVETEEELESFLLF